MFKRLLPVLLLTAATSLSVNPVYAGCSPVYVDQQIESLFAGGATQSQVWAILHDKYKHQQLDIFKYFENTPSCIMQVKGWIRRIPSLVPYSYQTFFGELPDYAKPGGYSTPSRHSNVTPGGHTMRGHTGAYGAPSTIYHGPRGGRFTVTPNGNRSYIN